MSDKVHKIISIVGVSLVALSMLSIIIVVLYGMWFVDAPNYTFLSFALKIIETGFCGFLVGSIMACHDQ